MNAGIDAMIRRAYFISPIVDMEKLILNMISTGVMIRLGMVYENMMINVRPTNLKLRDRAIRILSAVTGEGYDACGRALDEAGGSIRNAIDLLKK